MDAIDAAGYELVHGYPGGAPALAPLVDMRVGTLLNKANPDCPEHQFSVRQAVALQALQRRYPMLLAEARLLRHACIPLGEFPLLSDIALLDAYAKYHVEVGQMADAIRAGLADGRVTRWEYDRIEHEAFEAVRAMFELLARLKRVSEAPPA